MKRNYVAPIAKILLCEDDVIRTSVEVHGDDNVIFWPGTVKEEGKWE